MPAQVVGDRLADLERQNNGSITPGLVVDDARPDDAPTHPLFEWDDEVAAEEFRKEQARQVIRCVRVLQVDAKTKEEVPVLRYVAVTLPEDGHAYVTTARAMSDDDLREQAIGDALGGLKAWQKRYAHIKGLEPVVAAIGQAVRKVERAQARRPVMAARA